nr:MAG TPA: hypothetical protein [Herelleviridae sp.]
MLQYRSKIYHFIFIDKIKNLTILGDDNEKTDYFFTIF